MFPTSNKAPIDFNQYKDVTPAVGASSAKSAPISSNVLAPTQPIAIPASQPNTESQAFQASLEGLTTTSSATSEKGSKMESSFDELLSSLNNSATEGELTSGAYGVKGGVDESQAELQDINSQLLGEQEGLRRTIEGIQDNAEGLTRGGVAGKIDEARRKSLRTQADLAVIQMAKQGRYDSAKAIADRAINAQLEKQKQQQEIRRFVYEENKEAFTKAEQREFETKEKERDRLYERQERELKTLSDLSLDALTNGAPANVAAQMRAATTVEEAMRIGGRYVGQYDRIFKQAQIDNIKSQITDRNKQSVTTKPLTASQYSALGYGQRTLQSGMVIDEIGDQFTSAGSGMWLPNFLKSDERQKFEQAQLNFINANLRRESGAAISPEEFQRAADQYFPQRGDGQEVLIQKKQNRDLVIQNLLREGGQDTSPQDASLADPLSIGVGSKPNPLNL
jgi:hypothetical protein